MYMFCVAALGGLVRLGSVMTGAVMMHALSWLCTVLVEPFFELQARVLQCTHSSVKLGVRSTTKP